MIEKIAYFYAKTDAVSKLIEVHHIGVIKQEDKKMNYSVNLTNEIKEEMMAMKEGLEHEGDAETKSDNGLLRKVARAIKWLFSVRQSNDLYTTSYMYRFR